MNDRNDSVRADVDAACALAARLLSDGGFVSLSEHDGDAQCALRLAGECVKMAEELRRLRLLEASLYSSMQARD